MRSAYQRLRRLWKRFHEDSSGIAVIYVAAALPVIIGFSLLAIDVGRMSTLQSSLQHGADALALAAAGELDRGPDAITRANRALANLVTTNTSLFEDSNVVSIGSNDITAHYLDAIPASDSTAIDAGWLATHETAVGQDVRFVQVLVNPQNFRTIFPVDFLGGGSNTATTRAEAVAGFDAAVCNFTPLFMCNPFEPASGTTQTYADYGLKAHVASYTSRRKLIKFTALATGSGIPGQYGFLDPTTGNGKKALGDEIASTIPDLCYKRSTLSTKTGSMTDLRNAFNTRFDIFFGSYKSSDYVPAGNVRKGYMVSKNGKGVAAGDACKSSDNELAKTPSAFLGLPADSCFSSTCSPYANIGNGDWGYDPEIPATVDFTTYWNTNFSGVPIPSETDLGIGTGVGAMTNGNPPSRYDVYKYENTKIWNGSKLRENPSVGQGGFTETGLPNCSVGAGIDDPDRRILYGAIINCRAEGLSSGNGSGYRAVAFGKFFMTRPMPSTSGSELWLELVDLVEPGDANGVARDIVQLYR